MEIKLKTGDKCFLSAKGRTPETAVTVVSIKNGKAIVMAEFNGATQKVGVSRLTKTGE